MKRIILFVLLILALVTVLGCSQSGTTTIPAKESRWIVVDDGAVLKVSLDRQSITRNTVTGSTISQDATDYKVTKRDVVSCWIKAEIKEGHRAKAIESLKKIKPNTNIDNITHSMENIYFDLLTREYKVDEEILYDGTKEILREKINDKWEKLVPGDDYYEPVFEAVKKQLATQNQ